MFGRTAECNFPKMGFLKGQSAIQGFKVQLEGYKKYCIMLVPNNKTKTDTG